MSTSHHPLLFSVRSHGGKNLYYSIRSYFHWPELAVYFYATVRSSSKFSINLIKSRLNTTKLKLFPYKAPLEIVSIDLLVELIRASRVSRYLLVTTYCFTKLVKTIPMKTDSSMEVAKTFVHKWVFNYRPPVKLLSDNGGCFISRLF